MKKLITAYTFSPSTQKITLSDYSTINLSKLLLITNVTDNIILYNFADSALGATVATNVITLMYNTTSMGANDSLQIYYEDVVDGDIIFSGTLTSTGVTSAVDTSGFNSITSQITGTWIGNLYKELSNDKINWDVCYTLSIDEVSMQDVIDQNGTYISHTHGRYLRYKVTELVGSINIVCVGRFGESLRAGDLLSLAMDRTQNTPLQVQLPKDLKQDTTGALLFSDMAGPYSFNSISVSQPLVLDCTGYGQVTIQKTTAGIITPTISNDGINYVATLATNIVSGVAPATTLPAATGIYTIPVLSRYLKLTGPASAVSCTIYLSSANYNAANSLITPPMNLAQTAGTPTVTTGVAGMMAVGGNIATGVAATAAPVLVAGADNATRSKVTRTILTDETGQIQTGTTLNMQNIQNIRNSSMTDDKKGDDILALILLELKILNQQIYELPRLLITSQTATDEPDEFRNDPTIFQVY